MATIQSRKVGDKYEQFLLPLPKKVCDSLGIRKGDEFDVLVEGGAIVLKKGKRQPRRRVEANKQPPAKKPSITIEQIMAIGGEERKELIESAFKKGDIEEDMYREFGEWGWV